jgi:hypothetical protein
MIAKKNMVTALAGGDRGEGVEVIQVGRMTYDDCAIVQYPANGARTMTPDGIAKGDDVARFLQSHALELKV